MPSASVQSARLRPTFLVDAIDGTGLRAANTAIGGLAAAVKPATNEVFLGCVQCQPETLPDILAASRRNDLVRTNGAFVLAVAGDKCGFGKNGLLVSRELCFLHRLDGFDEARKVFRNSKRPR